MDSIILTEIVSNNNKCEEIKQKLIIVPLSFPIPMLSKNNKPLFLFDIDNTLYQQENGMHDNIVDLLIKYATIYVGSDEASKKVSEYYFSHGLTVKGFLKEHNSSLEKWVQIYNQNLQIEKFLHPDIELREILLSIKNKVQMWCFTNGCEKIGMRMLNSLNLSDVFDGMLHCEYTSDGNFMCKPNKEIYDLIEQAFEIKHPRDIYLFEDRDINIIIPRERNWNTYYITEENHIKKILKEVLLEIKLD